MPRGDKSAYTDKQKRMVEHIEEGYKDRGVPGNEAARRAWATVNAVDHGGKKSGAGRGKKRSLEPLKRGGKKGGGLHPQHDRSSLFLRKALPRRESEISNQRSN
jgi:hypothetical protein